MEKCNKSFKTKARIAYKYFEPTGKIDLSSINNNPTSTGVADIISHQNKKNVLISLHLSSLAILKIDKDGIYTFFTDSDDGSMLYIDDEEIVNNDGNHGNVEKSGKAALKKGYHKIKVLYFDSGGGNSLKVSYATGRWKERSDTSGFIISLINQLYESNQELFSFCLYTCHQSFFPLGFFA